MATYCTATGQIHGHGLGLWPILYAGFVCDAYAAEVAYVAIVSLNN